MLFIKNLTKAKVDEKFFRLVADKTLENLPKLAKNNKKIEIDLVIIGEKRMKGLNRAWRGKNKATDVLSFENEEKPIRLNGASLAESRWGLAEEARKNKFKFITPPDDIIYLGQIFICYSVMARQARRYGYSTRKEIARLLVHGILHLAGYDHEKSAEKEKKMFGLQEKILEKI